MSKKFGVIVEGQSDKSFFEDCFKKQYDLARSMVVIPSGSGDNCKIMNERVIKNKIQDLRDKRCSDIFVLVDLDSKCKKSIIIVSKSYVMTTSINLDSQKKKM